MNWMNCVSEERKVQQSFRKRFKSTGAAGDVVIYAAIKVPDSFEFFFFSKCPYYLLLVEKEIAGQIFLFLLCTKCACISK